MAVITPSEITTAAGAVPWGVTTRVLRMTRSARAAAMAGRRYVGGRGCRQGGAASGVGCGNPLTCRRNTRPLPESLLFSDSSVLHTAGGKAMPQKAARRVVPAPLFDVVVWHRSCESSHAEGSQVGMNARGSRERKSQTDHPHRGRSAGSDGVAGPAARVRAAGRVGVGARRGRSRPGSAEAGPVRPGAPLSGAPVSLVFDRVHGLHDRRDPWQRRRGAADRAGRRGAQALDSDAGRPSPDVRGRRVVGDGRYDPQSSERRALLVLLPGHAGRELGRPVVRGSALSGGCDHVRRPRCVDQPRHGGGATTAGGGYGAPACRAADAVTWVARPPSTLHGRPSLRLLRLGDTQGLRSDGPLGDTPEVPRHRTPGAILL